MSITEWDWPKIIIGILGSGAMSAGLVVVLFKALVGGWVNSKFDTKKISWQNVNDEKLTAFKTSLDEKLIRVKVELEARNEQNIEKMKSMLEYSVKRSLHFAEFEYTVIPKAWELTIDSINSFQKIWDYLEGSFDFVSATENDLISFLDDHDGVLEWQRNMMLRCAPDKREETWSNIISHILKEIIASKYSQAKSHIDLHAIFIDQALIKEFVDVLDFVWITFMKWTISERKKYDVEIQGSDGVSYIEGWLNIRKKQNALEGVVRQFLREKDVLAGPSPSDN